MTRALSWESNARIVAVTDSQLRWCMDMWCVQLRVVEGLTIEHDTCLDDNGDNIKVPFVKAY